MSVALVMPACNAHAPSHLRPALPYFSTLSHKQQKFSEKTLLKMKFVFRFFFCIFVQNICLSKKKWTRFYKYAQVFTRSTHYYLHISIKLYFYRPTSILEKYPNIKISLNSVQRKPSCYMRTDGRTKLTIAFQNFANSPPPPPKKRLKCLSSDCDDGSTFTAIANRLTGSPLSFPVQMCDLSNEEHLTTNSNPSWQDNLCLASYEIPRILQNPHSRPRMSYFFKIHFNIILPSMPRSCNVEIGI